MFADNQDSLEMYVADVEDNALDAPNLYKYLGILLGNLILKGVLRMQSISHMIEPLLSSRSRMPPASKLLGELLSAIRTEGGDAALLGVIQAEPVMYELYWPNGAFNDATLAEWIAKYNLAVLSQAMDQAVPMDLETKFKVLKGDAKEVSKWIEVIHNLFFKHLSLII